MSLPLDVHPEARIDILDAANYLEAEQPGQLTKFIDRIEDVLRGIHCMPEMHGVSFDGVRAATTRPYPYVVYYRVHPTSVQILAVLHGSRDQASWRHRL